MGAGYETLDWNENAGVAEITLNRADSANAVDSRMAHELFDAACRCEARGVRSVIITGKGRFFSVGGDLNEFSDAPDKADHVTRLATILHAALVRFAHLDAPVITAVNGPAGGAGFSIGLSGDLIFASQSASFVSAYTAAGLSPDGSSTYFLAKHVGLLRAKELMLTNRRLSAEEALAWGMATRVVPDDRLMPEARRLAQDLAAGPTKSFGAVKRLLETAFTQPLETQLEAEVQSIAAMMLTTDATMGIEAFLSKKAPNFYGS